MSCIVSGYAEPCCAAFRDSKPAQPATSSGGLPDNLDRPALAAGIATIHVGGCSGSGEVHISARVSPAGQVTSVTIKSSPSDALASCVVAAARKGTFAKTQHGGSFSYLWRF